MSDACRPVYRSLQTIWRRGCSLSSCRTCRKPRVQSFAVATAAIEIQVVGLSYVATPVADESAVNVRNHAAKFFFGDAIGTAHHFVCHGGDQPLSFFSGAQEAFYFRCRNSPITRWWDGDRKFGSSLCGKGTRGETGADGPMWVRIVVRTSDLVGVGDKASRRKVHRWTSERWTNSARR